MTPTAHICLTCQPPAIPALIDYPNLSAAITLMVIGVTLVIIAGGLVWKWHRATIAQRSHGTALKPQAGNIDTSFTATVRYTT